MSESVADAMVSDPKTLPPEVSVGTARAAFRDEHVHMLLLSEGELLRGTLVRDDLLDAPDDAPALPLAVIEGRTVPPDVSADGARQAMLVHGVRRLAVLADDGRLLGLLCLKRRLSGFCSDLDVEARAADADRVRGRPGPR